MKGQICHCVVISGVNLGVPFRETDNTSKVRSLISVGRISLIFVVLLHKHHFLTISNVEIFYLNQTSVEKDFQTKTV